MCQTCCSTLKGPVLIALDTFSSGLFFLPILKAFRSVREADFGLFL